MGLFGFGKKKQEPACACQSGCKTSEATEKELTNTVCSGNNIIKILGTGCKSCHTLLENTKQAVNNMSLDINVEYIQDMEKIVSYGVMSVPALVINEKPIVMGKVLKVSEIEELLKKAGF